MSASAAIVPRSVAEAGAQTADGCCSDPIYPCRVQGNLWKSANGQRAAWLWLPGLNA